MQSPEAGFEPVRRPSSVGGAAVASPYSSRRLCALRPGALLLGILALAACGGGGGSSGASFRVLDVGVQEGQVWRINRAIEITFSDDVDFATVSLNTIGIVDEHGFSATGSFSLATDEAGAPRPRVVRFQPTCPVLADLSDAGLRPGARYRLAVHSGAGGSPCVRSASGERLERGTLRSFKTPDSDDPLLLFQDVVPGPPSVRLRGAPGVPPDDPYTVHLVVGGQAVYFELDPATQTGGLPAGFDVPLNHYSIPENTVTLELVFDQPVLATAENVSSALLGIEYDDGGGWSALQARVELLENCGPGGARVRIAPRGLLPQGAALRAVVRPGFRDLTGDATTVEQTGFARMQAAAAGAANPLFPGVSNPEVDEFLEPFLVGGEGPASLEDTAPDFVEPPAHWGGGRLRAGFGFDGTGGPGGDFDWHVPIATELVINTVQDTIQGGPGGAPTKTQAVIGGVIDVRDLFVPESSRVLFIGPNPVKILASGNVRVLGELSVRGSDSPGVGTLGTANQPEPGAPGQAGGGDGGVASYLTTQSTPRGGPGEGAFGAGGQGGEGGETSFAIFPGEPARSRDARRGGGGGGGRLGRDVRYDYPVPDSTEVVEDVRCQVLVGLDAERGATGGAEGLGAESQTQRAQGGSIGPAPFLDEFADNDFLGAVALAADGSIVRGELDGLWAGAGGGAGGDAVDSENFPLVPFVATGDEKGAGGGGGAGGLQILALGEVVIGDGDFPGSLAAEGGDGGAGENDLSGGFKRLGGGSGGGSGGHIVVASATRIVIHGRSSTGEEDVDHPGNWWYADREGLVTHIARPLSAVGGQGGAGHNNQGGANEKGPTTWHCDRIPFDFAEGHLDVLPPFSEGCILNLVDTDDPVGGPVVGAGGDGGPGLVQLHVQDPADLWFPELELAQGSTWVDGLDVTPCSAPPPLGWSRPGQTPDQALPFFGQVSKARSRWVPLGLARHDPQGADDQVLLRFEGTDAEGIVPRDGTVVDTLAPILGPADLGDQVPPYLEPDGRTIVFDAADLAPEDDLYRANPNLLRQFAVRLEDASDGTHAQSFTVVAATHDAAAGTLALAVDPAGPALSDFQAPGAVRASVVPHWLRLGAAGVLDSYPPDTLVRVLWEATVLDPLSGGPDEDAGSGPVAAVGDLNLAHWDFARFEVEFDLDVSGDGVDLAAPRPALEHLRVSFTF